MSDWTLVFQLNFLPIFSAEHYQFLPLDDYTTAGFGGSDWFVRYEIDSLGWEKDQIPVHGQGQKIQNQTCTQWARSMYK
jgi:hypothetical protein